MKAIGYTDNLAIDNPLSLTEFKAPDPQASGHDLLVAVSAVSVNPVDTLQRQFAAQKGNLPRVLGYDGVGIVQAVGDDVTLFKPGDRVYYAGDITRPGSNAAAELIDERLVALAPKSLTDAQAAALPLTSLTAWEALFEVLGIDPTDRASNQHRSILLINGAGGAGSMAVQLAHWAGLHVIASASRPETIAWVEKLGADEVVNHRHDLVTEVRGHGHQYVDYIFDLHDAGRNWATMAELIAPGGRIVSITHAPGVDVDALKEKRASFGWEYMFSKAIYQTDMLSQHVILQQVASLIDAGQLRTTATQFLSPITAVNLRQAHALVESGRMIGKVVIANQEA
ncbi:zinc-binding alcohol dehydrogenase family protein [Lacticaseibacillus pabuli]|uniref:Zinc-type alcohol dehydrogenase-like protein n=1 Tax=Lacticaseibacillus pabuli TaxID=3025672 RepID=A0ABY7WSY9_9LACO|nr:zinc-binding alcohol dehydrogenase family protein [Lacticaseibacillus sp. KACC 23028]WDF83293.1 zinc-binding alcohol dehydrogenase family protein [Lacticaseibacillus sp. KACC 23028]